jgi:4,5-dihydroxyphthalate decarboxylase
MTRNNYSRRDFVKTTALAAGAVGSLSAFNQSPQQDAGLSEAASDDLSLSAAGYRFRRHEALFDGRVTIDGCEVEFEQMGVGDMNTNVFSGPQSLDFTEIGLHPFMLAYANDGFRDYTLLPVFPLRVFRHKSIFIRTDRGIKKPEDLIGKTIATPGYASTSLTWIRGVLQDEYGVKPEDVDWIFSAADSSADISGKASKQEQALPEGLSIKAGPPGKDESDLLESGEADALFHAVEPRAWIQRDPIVARLFPDSRSVERAYFDKTGIFPIMHAVAIKKQLLEDHPWLAEAVFNAYSQSKKLADRYMTKLGWGEDMLPWYGQELEATRSLMGQNFYSYGIEGNRKSLDALFRYSHEQGFMSRELMIEELFDPLGMELAES